MTQCVVSVVFRCVSCLVQPPNFLFFPTFTPSKVLLSLLFVCFIYEINVTQGSKLTPKTHKRTPGH